MDDKKFEALLQAGMCHVERLEGVRKDTKLLEKRQSELNDFVHQNPAFMKALDRRTSSQDPRIHNFVAAIRQL